MFTIARTWRQPRCSLIDELDNEAAVRTHNGILLSIKWNKYESVAVRWKNLQRVIQSEALRKRKTNIAY